jgi:serpin B
LLKYRRFEEAAPGTPAAVGAAMKLGLCLLPLLPLSSLLAGGAAIVACSGGGPGSGSSTTPPPATVTEARSSQPRDSSPNVSSADQAALETGNLDFAFAMYGALRGSSSSNLFFAPYSMSGAVAMTYAGAQGQTASEIATAMGFSLPPARLHPAFDWLDLQLASRASATDGPSSTPFTLHVTNSVWGDKTLTFQQPFLDTLSVDYGAGVEVVDFGHDPEGARVAIDKWVSDQTSGRVPQILPPGSVDNTTLFALVDAIYFHADWASPFDNGATSAQPFTRSNGTTEQVSTMAQTTTFSYASGDGWQLVELPYVGNQVAMDIVLPAKGSESSLEASLTASKFQSMVGGLQPTLVELSLPKLHLAGASFSIKQQLEALGIQTAFGDGADFTPMTLAGVHLTDAFHQAFLAVDEKGTEAAGATAIVGGDGGIAVGPQPTPVPFVVDHPFFLTIRDLPTGTVLFAGQIDDPSSGS